MSVNSSIDSKIRLHFVYLSIESKVDQKLKIPLSA